MLDTCTLTIGNVIMIKRISFIFLIAIIAPATAMGNVYRCVMDDGTVRFSDVPCVGDSDLFIKEERLSIDEVIALASPFPDLTIYSSSIDNELVSHAKKLGEILIPDDAYVSYEMRGREQSSGRYPSWEVIVNFGQKDNRPKWSITVNYDVRQKNDILRIWMHTIYVRLTGTLIDAPSIRSAESLKRLKAGKYQVHWWLP